MKVEVPGIDPDKDLHVTLTAQDLAIRGERTRSEEINEKDYYRSETSYGAFERHIPVPEGTTDKDVEAAYKDGILEVVIKGASLDKTPPANAIPVRTESESG